MSVAYLTWRVDHGKRSIFVTVRLALIAPRRIDQKSLELLRTWILEPWKNAKFKCYSFVIELILQSVTTPAGVPSGFFPITVTRGGGSSTFGDPTILPLSEAPGQFRKSTHGTWDIEEAPSAWAHELGHVLGLDDGYVKKRVHGQDVEFPQSGHTPDIMMIRSLAASSQTITRIVRRSGAIDETQIRCPLTFDTNEASAFLVLASLSNLRVHAWTCNYDPPSDDPSRPPRIASFEGMFAFQGGYLADLHGTRWEEARAIIGALTAIDTTPLSVEHSGDQQIRFELSLDRTQLGRMATPALEIWSPFRIPFQGGVLEGKFRWDAQKAVPILQGPLSLGGWSSTSWLPGPPLMGEFKHGASECR